MSDKIQNRFGKILGAEILVFDPFDTVFGILKKNGSLPYLRNGWDDYPEIWCAVRDQLSTRFILANGKKHLDVSTCVSVFHISGAATHTMC